MKVGIIRCDTYSDSCPAGGCLRAVREATGHFEGYDEVTLVGLDTCGGCYRGKGDLVGEKAERLKKAGAEAVHLGNCMVGTCPYTDVFAEAVQGMGLEVIRGTH